MATGDRRRDATLVIEFYFTVKNGKRGGRWLQHSVRRRHVRRLNKLRVVATFNEFLFHDLYGV